MFVNKKKLVIAHLLPSHTVDQFSLSEKKEGPWVSMLPYSYGIFWLSMSLMSSFCELSPELAAMET